MASFWRCIAGTAGALCWCCLVGENSRPLQLSEEFKLVSETWNYTFCPMFNDLQDFFTHATLRHVFIVFSVDAWNVHGIRTMVKICVRLCFPSSF